MAFIKTNSGQFQISGGRFRFIGGNHYPLIQAGYTKSQLDSFFAACKSKGITVVRTWAFNKQPTAGNVAGNFWYTSGSSRFYIETTYQQMDLVMDRARAAGVRIILSLCDEYPQFSNDGIKQQYTAYNNTVNGTAYDHYNYGDEFHSDANILAQFEADIAKIVSRVNTVNGLIYKNDDTIFSFELGNELRFNIDTDTNVNTSSSFRVQTMLTWMTAVSAYIKSIDPNHLVGTGSVTQFYDYVTNDPIHNGSYYGLDYTLDHQISTIDYFDFHLYPFDGSGNLTAYGQSLSNPNSPTAKGLTDQLNQFVSLAKSNGKPVVMGELGLDKRATNAAAQYPVYPRNTFFSAFFQAFFKLGGDGAIFWHISSLVTGFDDFSFNVLLDAAHTGGNANGNLNDSDANITAFTTSLNQLFQVGRRLSVGRTLAAARTKTTRSLRTNPSRFTY